MSIVIQKIDIDLFPRCDAIPNWFEVESVFRVEVMDGGLGGFRLVEEKLAESFIKDYDSQGDDNPTSWAANFDVSGWGIFWASDDDRSVGGAAVALDAPVYPMDQFQRRDLAVLWDIRVHPDDRGRRIGAKLFRHAADWARRQGRGNWDWRRRASTYRRAGSTPGWDANWARSTVTGTPAAPTPPTRPCCFGISICRDCITSAIICYRTLG